MEIHIESRERLLSLDFLEGLAIRIADLNLSRVKTTDWLASKIFFFDGTIYDWNGRPLYLDSDIVDRAYGRDIACSWNSEVKMFAARPPIRRPSHRLLLRLALWDSAMKINLTPVLS
ncbi:hypothetical protein HNO88_001489 [Novosphingobium chloroacetimidivorans]|uniref:Uncharacterized protein n=1 Tax=Novosphingobium chloroacetimidivorans TaxID=1428314 RepID=A0A7W7NWH5_9SPHN|nr:hypothetical protein [Novosphingobium chloroacetimidivorans]MBB4858170.1 hypothetical protein [Novosphingobium chloroacetimidivorans]